MAIANTTIRIKKSLSSGNVPSTLANGEIAINAADGKLYYATPTGSISFLTNQQSFATVNANGSLILASSPTDTLSIVAGNNISIISNTTSKTITINSTGGPGSSNSVGYREVQEFTATAGQTTYSAYYIPNYVDVYRNGIRLSETDYTASDGSNVVLQVGANANDTIVIETFYVDYLSNGAFVTDVTITNNLSSTNTTTGALKVTGGVGIIENLNVGGKANIIGQLTLTSTGDYNLYSSGTGKNYLLGNLGVGTLPTANAAVRIGKILQGPSPVFGVESLIRVDTGISSAYNFLSSVSTEAASFTLSDLRHFSSSGGTFGAGSTVTDQFGYYASSNLTGATNNYGFYSNIPSGTNRWNFYAGGTADNYFAGNVGIGSAASGYKFLVYNTAGSHGVARLYQANTSYNTDLEFVNDANITSTSLISKRTTGDMWLYQSGANQITALTSAVTRFNISGTGTISLGGAPGSESLRVTPITNAVNYLQIYGSAAGGSTYLLPTGTDTNIGMTLYTKGTSPFGFQTNSGNEQFRIAHTASAVNYITASGAATTSYPSLSANGSDTDIGITYAAKGAGFHQFFSAGGSTLQLRIAHTASAVNYLQVGGGATGSSVYLLATGSDTNVSFSHATKGSGNHSFTTGGGSVTQFYITHTASAVDFISVTGSAAATPTLYALGSNTNVSMVYTSKGSGSHVFSTGTYGSGITQFGISHTVSAVNYLNVSGSATGVATTITALGSDTDIGISLVPKGAGVVTTNGSMVVSANSSANALRITQTGTGNALLVEDSANPDASPVVIDAEGRLIVGSTGSFGGYQYQSQSNSGASFNAMRFSVDSGAPFFRFDKSRAAVIGGVGAVSDGDGLGTVLFRGDDGTSLISSAQISASVDGTPGTNDMPGRLVFFTTADGASSPTERMRIDNQGRIGIGGANLGSSGVQIAKFGVPSSNISYSVHAYSNPPVTSTAIANYFHTWVTTIANGGTPYTLSNVRHYATQQLAFNADSTVTNQYGFFADSSLTGATNNYGFSSNIPAGTGRWNFYANGSADNYFAGRVGVGTTTPTTNKSSVVHISGVTSELRVESSDNSTGTPNSLITLKGYAARVRAIEFTSEADTNVASLGLFYNAGAASTTFELRTANTNRLSITSAGVISLGAAAGSESLRVTPVTSAVNYLNIQGNTAGGPPSLTAVGSDTNINLYYAPKGTGSHLLVNGSGALQFVVASTASAVNYLQATGAITNVGPNISAQGSDTNINLGYITKGTGGHFLTTGGGSGTIQFLVAHTASAVNYLQVTGGATNNAVVFSAQGSDANIDIQYRAKGTYSHLFTTGGGLQFLVGNTASAVNYLQLTGGDGTTTSPRLLAAGSSTDVTIQMMSKGAGEIQFFTNSGNRQFTVGHTASAVNYLQVAGSATGGGVALTSQGSDATVNINYWAKGSGAHIFATGSYNSQLQVVHTASAVNYLQVTGNITSQGPILSAQGSDANIVLNYSAKGAVGHSFFTGGTSYLTQLQITHTASAVNYLRVTGAVTGGNPVLSSQGIDTNIGLSFATKGTASTFFYSNSTVPTFAIGGTAASNDYLGLQVSTGNIDLYSTGSSAAVNMRLFTKGTGSHQFITGTYGSGVAQFVVNHTASAVNFLSVTGGATGISPYIISTGSDANVGMGLTTKGTGGIGFSTNNFGSPAFAITHTASAVNYLQVTGAATGGAPNILAAGSDSVITLGMSSKGAAPIQFRTDSFAGLQFVVAHTASAVNYLQATGNSTGLYPSLTATGSDTNVSFVLNTKGNGFYQIYTGNQEQFRIAHTAATVNYLQVTGNATTGAPILSAQGSDTNVNILLLSKGTGGHVFTTGSVANPQFVVSHTASAVNYFQITGAASEFPVLSVQGSSTNISPVIAAKGSGSIYFQTSATTQFLIAHTASAVNYLQITGGVSGATPRLFSSTANIPVGITGSNTWAGFGNASVAIGVATDITNALGAHVVIGSLNGNAPYVGSSNFSTSSNNGLSIRTNGVLQFLITHTASAVNYLQVTGSGTGNRTAFSVQGSDTNVGINYNAKGAEYHVFTTSGGVAQFVIQPTASAVNHMYLTGGTTGNAPVFSAQGSDTNIGITLTPKGTGGVAIGATSAGGYKLYVNGSFAATTKSFVIDHPTKPNMKLRYGSLEGPENGVYVRGRLKDNNTIELPDYWTGLVDEDSITVNITPIGKSQNLFVEDIIDNKVIIGGSIEINCFYTVFAERKDVDKLLVEF